MDTLYFCAILIQSTAIGNGKYYELFINFLNAHLYVHFKWHFIPQAAQI